MLFLLFPLDIPKSIVLRCCEWKRSIQRRILRDTTSEIEKERGDRNAIADY